MEVKTKEIRRYVLLEFEEKDLQELANSVSYVISKLEKNRYEMDEIKEKAKKISEFANVIREAIGELHA